MLFVIDVNVRVLVFVFAVIYKEKIYIFIDVTRKRKRKERKSVCMLYICTKSSINGSVPADMSVYVCLYVCVCARMCVHLYLCLCLYTHSQTLSSHLKCRISSLHYYAYGKRRFPAKAAR